MDGCDFNSSRDRTAPEFVRLDASSTYLVPYLPVTPTFLVRFVIFADVAAMNDVGDGGSWAFRGPP